MPLERAPEVDMAQIWCAVTEDQKSVLLATCWTTLVGFATFKGCQSRYSSSEAKTLVTGAALVGTRNRMCVLESFKASNQAVVCVCF